MHSGLKIEAIEGALPLLKISGICIVTKKPYAVVVPAKGFEEWRQGEYIQEALSMVSKEDCEFLISGTSPEGWDIMWGEDES